MLERSLVLPAPVRNVLHELPDVAKKGKQIVQLPHLRVQIVVDAGLFLPAFDDAHLFQDSHMVRNSRAGKIGFPSQLSPLSVKVVSSIVPRFFRK